MSDSKNVHWVLGLGLFILAVFVVVALVGVNSQADEINSSAGVANASPTVDSIFFDTVDQFQIDADGTEEADGTISLASGSDVNLYISGVVSDANGDSDIVKVETVFYAPDGTNELCDMDPNDCYQISSCGTQANDNDSITYNCPILLSYWANSTMIGGKNEGGDWTAWVQVQDSSGAKVFGTDTIDVETLLSLGMPGPVNWGTLAQNTATDSAQNEDQIITQKGNDKADIQVYGTDMPCSNTGTIPVANIKWDLNDDGFSTGGTVLSGNPGSPDTIDITIPFQLEPGSITDLVHWDVQIPQYDISGTCTGTITMTAVASAD